MQVKPNDTENVETHRPQAVDLQNAFKQSKLNVRMTEFFKVSAICVCLQLQCFISEISSFVAQYDMSVKNKHLDSLVSVLFHCILFRLFL